jgi:hypothetical protein
MDAATRTCPSCFRTVPWSWDFCSCGEYLHWELDDPVVEPDPEPPPPPPLQRVTPVQPMPAVQPPLPPVALDLRLPDAGPPADAHLQATVMPGTTERVLVLVRNQSSAIYSLQLALDGLPAEWFSIHPRTVDLWPYDSGGTFEQEVEIHLHPPRAPEAEARLWDVSVTAQSVRNHNVAATAAFALQIARYADFTTTLRPGRVRARRRAAFNVVVANNCNGPAYVALQGQDFDGVLRFEFDRPAHEVPVGAAVATRMWVSVAQPIWTGNAEDHPFAVQTFTSEDGSPMMPTSGTFRQVPWLSWSEMAAIGVLALLAILLVLLV